MTRPGPISPPSALRPAVQVLGPFNSGTSLMSSYLAELFDVRSGFNLVFWKHSLAPDYRRYGKGNRLEPFTPPRDSIAATTFVVMVRNPYFWMLSTARKHYQLRFSEEADSVEARLASPVRLFEHEATHLVEIWAAYYDAYRSELEPRSRLIYVRLEDLVTDPERELERLRDLPRRPGVDVAATIAAIDAKPAKDHGGACVAGDEARRLYSVDRIPETLGSADLAAANARLDQSLMQRFGYSTVVAPRRAWHQPVVLGGSG